MAGKLIVIEGSDGSGKATQTALLVKKLGKFNHEVETIDFPQYNKWSSIFVKKYLNGDFGSNVNPYATSLFYALDRFELCANIRQLLEQDKLIIANRYVSSNQAYQAAKLKDESERKQFMAWLDNLEHNILQLPRPSLVIYLHVPLEISQKLMDHRVQKKYIEDGKKDLHEKDLEFLKNVQSVYELLSKEPGWARIDCTKDGEIMPKEKIHELVWDKIKVML